MVGMIIVYIVLWFVNIRGPFHSDRDTSYTPVDPPAAYFNWGAAIIDAVYK